MPRRVFAGPVRSCHFRLPRPSWRRFCPLPEAKAIASPRPVMRHMALASTSWLSKAQSISDESLFHPPRAAKASVESFAGSLLRVPFKQRARVPLPCACTATTRLHCICIRAWASSRSRSGPPRRFSSWNCGLTGRPTRTSNIKLRASRRVLYAGSHERYAAKTCVFFRFGESE